MNNFQTQITFFESELENLEKRNLPVSEASVGWHVAHCCLVMSGIINALHASNPSDYKAKFNWKKSIIFFTNKIPRGKGKSPDRVKPREEPTKESLKIQFEEVKRKIALLESLDKNAFFEHPYFGNLRLNDTVTFMQIHNNHHAKIIKDINK